MTPEGINMYQYSSLCRAFGTLLRCFKAMAVTAVNAGTFTPRRAAKYLDVPLDVEEAPGETWPTRTWRQVQMISRLDW